MYCRCSSIEYARKVFDENGESRKLTICYNALISRYTSNSRFYDGILLFRKMREAGASADLVTMLGLVLLCMLLVHLSLGMCLHGCCVKVGLDNNMPVSNCLLTIWERDWSWERDRDWLFPFPVLISGEGEQRRSPYNFFFFYFF